ncbi:MAG: glycosyltransferase family 39 protein [Verrucomicrobiales bacterium]
MNDLCEPVPAGTGGAFARWLWLGTLLLCFIVYAQHFYGVGFTKTIEIESDSLRSDGGHAWKLKLPTEHRAFAARHHLKVFEDGKEIGPNERSNNRVRKHGSGRFRMDEKGTLRMSASDNSSIALNLRKYTLKVPARVKPLQLVGSVVLLLVASWLVWRRGDVPLKKSIALPAIGWVAGLVLVTALIVRFLAMEVYAGFSDGGFSVNGIPYSDAMGWLDQATALFRGNGFHGVYAGQRPFYSVFLAAAYHLFGESLSTGRVINLGCGALSCLFLFLFIARATGRRGMALAAVVAFLFAHQQLTDLQLLITEPMGLTFIIAGAYAWWAGLLRMNPWALFAAGALIGLSNLTRTFTMLGLPLFAFITLGGCLLQRLPWKRTILVCTLFTLGATCVMAPWMIRQKLRFDTFSLSTAGSDLLYSAATDSPGWNADLYDELKTAGIEREDSGAVHAYYATRYAETVKQAPVRYFKRLVSWIFEYLTTHDFGSPLTRMALLIAGSIIAMRSWAGGRALAGTCGFIAAVVLASVIGKIPPGLVLAFSSTAAFMLGGRAVRWGIVVLLATLLSGAFMSAMIGNFGMNRMTPLTSWVFTAILFISFEAVAIRFAGRPTTGKDDEEPEKFAWRGLASITVWGMLAISLLAAATVAATGFSHIDEKHPELTLDEPQRASVRDWVREQLPGAQKADDDVFFISVVRMEPFIGLVQAKEDTSHWARPFLPREYARTVAFVRVLPGEMAGGSLMGVQLRCRPEELKSGKRDVLVGVTSIDEDAPLGHDKTMVEGFALIPFSGEGAQMEFDFKNAQTFPVTPEAAAIMSGTE